MSDIEEDITLTVTLHPDDSGAMRTVMVGLGRPTIVVEALEQDGGMVLAVEGSGSQEELAAVLFTVATTLDPTLLEPEE